jgi:hypothetical protein
MSQPVVVQPRRVPSRAPVDLNRSANRPQVQLIADPNSAPIDEHLRQRDLKLAGHLRHGPIISRIKDLVKDWALIPAPDESTPIARTVMPVALLTAGSLIPRCRAARLTLSSS